VLYGCDVGKLTLAVLLLTAACGGAPVAQETALQVDVGWDLLDAPGIARFGTSEGRLAFLAGDVAFVLEGAAWVPATEGVVIQGGRVAIVEDGRVVVPQAEVRRSWSVWTGEAIVQVGNDVDTAGCDPDPGFGTCVEELPVDLVEPCGPLVISTTDLSGTRVAPAQPPPLCAAFLEAAWTGEEALVVSWEGDCQADCATLTAWHPTDGWRVVVEEGLPRLTNLTWIGDRLIALADGRVATLTADGALESVAELSHDADIAAWTGAALVVRDGLSGAWWVQLDGTVAELPLPQVIHPTDIQVLDGDLYVSGDGLVDDGPPLWRGTVAGLIPAPPPGTVTQAPPNDGCADAIGLTIGIMSGEAPPTLPVGDDASARATLRQLATEDDPPFAEVFAAAADAPITIDTDAGSALVNGELDGHAYSVTLRWHDHWELSTASYDDPLC
jgi:hypothetical protein